MQRPLSMFHTLFQPNTHKKTRRNQFWYGLLITMIGLAMVGCSLSSSEDAEDTDDDDNVVIIQEPTEEVQLPTSTPQPTQTAQPDDEEEEEDTNTGSNSGSNAGSGSNVVVNCTIRTDWPVYTVVTGDTTSSIAQRVNSTVNSLADANCLSDPSRIRVGQQFRVPRLPDPDIVVRGFLSVSSHNGLDGDIYTIAPNRQIDVTWTQAPSAVRTVDFLLYPPDGLSYSNLGTDAVTSNGVRISWSVPGTVNGFIIARGKDSNGREIAVSPQMRVRTGSSGTQVTGEVDLSPIITMDGNTAIIEEGKTVQLRWDESANFSGLGQIEFVLHPTNNSQPVSLGIDTTPGNGASVNWTVPAGVLGRITAGGRFANHDVAISIDRYVRSERLADLNRGRTTVTANGSTQSGQAQVSSGSTVTLNWENGPAFQEASSATFYFLPVGIGATLQTLGTDNNLADGISLSWNVNLTVGTSGFIIAESRLSNGSLVRNETNVTVDVISGSNTLQGTISVTPHITTDGGWIVVQPGASVTLRWQDGPQFPNATSATFYLAPTGTGTTGTPIGTDNSLSDGANITWTVPTSFGGHLFARATVSNGQTVESQTLSVDAQEGSGGGGRLTASPATQVEPNGDTYQVATGSTVTLRWPEAPTSGVNRIEFYLTPSGTGQSPTLFATDNNAADGATYSWAISGGLLARFTAKAFMNNGTVLETASSIRLVSES